MRRGLRLLLLSLAGALFCLSSCGEDQSGARPAAEAPPAPDAFSRLDADRVFGPLAADDPTIYADPTAPTWFLLHLKRGSLASVSLGPPPAYKPGDALELTVVAYRTHPGTLTLQASWAGTDLGTQSSEPDLAGARVELHFDVPPGAVPPTLNALDLHDVSPPLPKRSRTDVSDDRGSIWIDRIEVGVVGRPGGQQGPRTGPGAVGSTPLRTAMPLQAEHVIVAVPALLAGARRLAAHRTATGTPSAVIDVRDIEGDLLAGVGTLVAQLAEHKRLRFVLLAGDASYDRTDLIEIPTIPAPMARTMYNGATAADQLYLPAGSELAIGRLPFRTAAEMQAYVDRLIAYETSPPAHASRRLLRFVTNEGRFGALIDNAIEHLFRGVLADQIPPAFDVEITFASARSPFLWPPRDMNRKVIESLNEGAMFFTYVGHGFQFGFDSLRVGRTRFPILHAKHVPQVDIRGTPPIAFVIACTTAQFDDPRHDGIGEALLKRPRGPIAYWGASRVCHPVANSLVGVTIAKSTARLASELRLGQLIRRSWDAAADPGPDDAGLKRIRLFSKLAAGGVDIDRLVVEGRLMYTLLGDPALKIAYPRSSLRVTQEDASAPDAIVVRVEAPLPDGTEIHLSLEKTRDQQVHDLRRVTDVLDPAQAAAIRENHRLSNDWSLHRTTVRLQGGRAKIRFTLEGNRDHLIAKAWAIAEGDVHQGAARILD